jgi:hypothetical protein
MVSRVPLSRLERDTSDQRDAAFDYTFSLFVEVESVSTNTGVNSSLIEKGFDHMEKITALVGL